MALSFSIYEYIPIYFGLLLSVLKTFYNYFYISATFLKFAQGEEK